MRTFDGELAGKQLTLAATFGASIKIAKEVGDPLMIAREANLEALLMSRGMPYHPRWNFTVENVPEIIHIGVKEAGSKMSLKDVQELVFEAGFPAARDMAVEYLALIVGPQPETSLGGDSTNDEDESSGN